MKDLRRFRLPVAILLGLLCPVPSHSYLSLAELFTLPFTESAGPGAGLVMAGGLLYWSVYSAFIYWILGRLGRLAR